MRLSFPVRKSAALAVMLAASVVLVSVPSASLASPAAVNLPAAQAISIRSTFVTNGSNKSVSSFKNGDSVVYHVTANNSSSRTLNVTVAYFVSTITSSGGILSEYIIADKSYSVKMPPGVSKFHTSSKIPQGATAGSYTLEGVVFENANRSDNDTVMSRPFAVKRIVTYPLKVPYFSQFQESPANNECGETAVAMTAAYYVDLYDSPKAWIAGVRHQMGISRSAETNAKQLTAALWGLQEMQITVTSISNKATIAKVISTITSATKQGYPVIAFIDATKLTPRRPYSGHWIVITGISGKYVYVNDPDNLKPPQGTGVSGTTKWPLAEYEAAAKSGAVGQGQPYGLIVKGEDFKSA